MPGTYTYDASDLSTDLAVVRFVLGDTTAPGTFSDEEIEYALDTWGSSGRAALQLARIQLSRYAGDVDKAVGDLKIFAGTRYRGWLELIRQLESVVSSTAPIGIYVGGQSRSEQDTDDLDLDMPQPFFKRGMHNLRRQDWWILQVRADAEFEQ